MTRQNNKHLKREINIIHNFLSISGLWPYTEKHETKKFTLSCIITGFAAIAATGGCFINDKEESTLFAIFRASLYVHTFVQRCVFKYNRNSFKILFNCIFDNWKYSRYFNLRDKQINYQYINKTRQLIYLIYLLLGISAFSKQKKKIIKCLLCFAIILIIYYLFYSMDD